MADKSVPPNFASVSNGRHRIPSQPFFNLAGAVLHVDRAACHALYAAPEASRSSFKAASNSMRMHKACIMIHDAVADISSSFMKLLHDHAA